MSKRKQSISKYLAEIGRRGGAAKVPKGAAKLTAEQLAERVKRMVKARKAKAALNNHVQDQPQTAPGNARKSRTRGLSHSPPEA